MMPTFSKLVALKVVIMTAIGTTSQRTMLTSWLPVIFSVITRKLNVFYWITTHLLSIESADWSKLYNIFKACDTDTRKRQFTTFLDIGKHIIWFLDKWMQWSDRINHGFKWILWKNIYMIWGYLLPHSMSCNPFTNDFNKSSQSKTFCSNFDLIIQSGHDFAHVMTAKSCPDWTVVFHEKKTSCIFTRFYLDYAQTIRKMCP